VRKKNVIQSYDRLEEVSDDRIINYGTWTACPLDIIPFDFLMG